DGIQVQFAHLTDITLDADAQARGEELARDGAGRHPHHRLARRGTPAAAAVAQAVLLLAGVIGVAGAGTVLDLLVVARALVGVLVEPAYGRVGGHALDLAGEDAHLVRFLALASEMRGAGAAPPDVGHQLRLADGQPGRTAI